MLQPPFTWSLSPRAVLIAQGRREAAVIPIFAGLQGRPEDYWLKTQFLFGHVSGSRMLGLGEDDRWNKNQDSFYRGKKIRILWRFQILWVRMIHFSRLPVFQEDNIPHKRVLKKLSRHGTGQMSSHDQKFKILLVIPIENF